YNKAFELYHKAANSGNRNAQNNLASMYECGKGVEKDINQAIYCQLSDEQNISSWVPELSAFEHGTMEGREVPDSGHERWVGLELIEGGNLGNVPAPWVKGVKSYIVVERKDIIIFPFYLRSKSNISSIDSIDPIDPHQLVSFKFKEQEYPNIKEVNFSIKFEKDDFKDYLNDE
ncbi:hypothetical protein RhiirA4_484001, partial [Rhizophagus irregularis]